jgi:8-oxo-dGTP pyrophosphatase MutT (NUDIX family)
MAKQPQFDFGYHPSVAEFAVSKYAYLNARPDASFGYIATSSLVLDTRDPSNHRVLLLQRAADDEDDPNKWEPPGGACDDDDESILYGAARELWEEAGLQVAQFTGQVGEPYFFTLNDGKRICRFKFVANVKGDSKTAFTVRLNPREHQRFVWATVEEFEARKVDEIRLDFTSEDVYHTVLQAFKNFGGK